MPDQPNVRVGQVWADNDKRDLGRHVQIMRLYSVKEYPKLPGDRRDYAAGQSDVWYATCEVVRDDRKHRIAPSTVGRRVEIRLDRFRPTSTGYRLVKDVPRG